MSDEQLRQDELVSACLDGEATPAEIAEVEQDDALMARVEQLRSVSDAAAAPVAPVSDELRDRMISTALAAVDVGTAQRREARTVPIHRRRETLLAVAAAAVLLAAVVSAGLIAGRGGDESAEMAAAPTESADASTAADEAAPAAEEEPMDEAAPAAEEEPAVAATTTAAYAEMPEEESMADLEVAVDTAAVANETASAAAAAAAAEAESAMEAPAEETADAPTPSAEEGRRTADDAAQQIVDLGQFESLESLFDSITSHWSAALEDGTTADSGTCSAAVHEQALALDVETAQPFIATVGTEDPLTFDARFARRADGPAIIIYAAPPNCETGTYEQDESDRP